MRSLLALLAAATLGAQRPANPREALVVSTAWLAQHLKDPNLVVLHAGNDYDARHIPGARLAAVDDISESDHTGKGLMLEMPAPDELRAKLAALGISDNSRIVVYSTDDDVPQATRVVFTLDYAGLGDHVSLLDGGLTAWLKDKEPVTTVIPAKTTGTLAPLKIKPIVVTADYVKAHAGKPGVSIVDGRAAAYYDGVRTGSGHAGAHRTGHIAGAKSVPFALPYTDGNFIKSNADIAAIFAKAGIAPNDTVVGYCHIGQQATAMLFAARLLGHPVALYDGSFEDWSRRPAAEYPVDNPSAKGKP